VSAGDIIDQELPGCGQQMAIALAA